MRSNRYWPLASRCEDKEHRTFTPRDALLEDTQVKNTPSLSLLSHLSADIYKTPLNTHTAAHQKLRLRSPNGHQGKKINKKKDLNISRPPGETSESYQIFIGRQQPPVKSWEKPEDFDRLLDLPQRTTQTQGYNIRTRVATNTFLLARKPVINL